MFLTRIYLICASLSLSLPKLDWNMATQDKEKQERKVVHLQMGDFHEYFGSIEQLFCKYSKEQLGFSIYQVRNNLRKLGTMTSANCTIRVGVLQTKIKKDN